MGIGGDKKESNFKQELKEIKDATMNHFCGYIKVSV